MSVPKLSVIVVTYNHEAYIGQCLDSILMQQTQFDFDIIIGEDESTDGTRQICREYANRYPGKIRLYERDRTQLKVFKDVPLGRHNFIQCLQVAEADFLAFCEGDDYWTDPRKLQKQCDVLESDPNTAICYHQVDILKPDSEELKHDHITRQTNEESNIKELAKGNFMHTVSVVIKNDFKIPSWFQDSPLGDWTLYMIALSDRKVRRLDEKMAVYRVHEDGIWSPQQQQARDMKTYKSVQLVLDKIQDLPAGAIYILNKRIEEYRRKLFPSVKWASRIKQKLKSLWKTH